MSRNINTPTGRKQSGDEVTVNIDTGNKTEVRPLSPEGESSRRGAIVFGVRGGLRPGGFSREGEGGRAARTPRKGAGGSATLPGSPPWRFNYSQGRRLKPRGSLSEWDGAGTIWSW